MYDSKMDSEKEKKKGANKMNNQLKNINLSQIINHWNKKIMVAKTKEEKRIMTHLKYQQISPLITSILQGKRLRLISPIKRKHHELKWGYVEESGLDRGIRLKMRMIDAEISVYPKDIEVCERGNWRGLREWLGRHYGYENEF